MLVQKKYPRQSKNTVQKIKKKIAAKQNPVKRIMKITIAMANASTVFVVAALLHFP